MEFFEVAQDMLCIAVPEGRFVRVNEAWTRTLGWTAEELCSRPYEEFIHPEDRERTDVETDQLSQGRETLRFRNRYRHKDGGYHWIDWRAVLHAESGEIYASARDVTREVLLHQKLVAREELLTTMVAQQLRAREDEHRRIANELHDSALQHSVAALMLLDTVPVDDAAVREPLGMVREEVSLALDTTRRVMQGLDPLDLGEQTLEAALRAVASEMETRFGIPVQVTIQPVGLVEDQAAAALCRMVREALVNAAKHASATTLAVALESDDQRIWVAVRDDGRGMQAAANDGSADRSGTGLGIAFMHERAASLNGSLEVVSGPTGTQVRMSIPRDTPRPSFDPGSGQVVGVMHEAAR